MQVFSQVFGPTATKFSICIQLSVVLHDSKGIIDRTPFRGHLGFNTQRKIHDFAVDSSFLLGFSTDCYQIQYMHSTNKSASYLQGNFRSDSIQGSFWVKNFEKNFSVKVSFLLSFLTDCYQTRYMHSTKYSASQMLRNFRSDPIQGSFWAKNFDKICVFPVDVSFLLGFLTNCYQTRCMHLTKHSAS